MKGITFRVAVATLVTAPFASYPALADLPPFDIQTGADGSKTATMGRQVKVWCDYNKQLLVFEYFADEALPPVNAEEPLGFVADAFAEAGEKSETIEMKVVLEGPGHLVGRAPVDEKLMRVLEAQHMAVIAPSEMGEPWYTGRSDALLEVARSCRD